MTPQKLGLLCGSSSLGGLEMNLVKLGKWMTEKGVEVVLYLVEGTPIHDYAVEHGLTIRAINKHARYFDWTNARKLKKMLEQDEVDTLLFRDARDMSLLGWAKTFGGNKLRLLYWQAMQLGVDKSDPVHSIRFKKVDAWLTLLPFMAQEVQDKTRFPKERLHIVPLGLELDRFIKNPITKSEARKRLELPSDTHVVGVIGRLDPKKGQKTAIEAIAKLKQKGQIVHLLLVGESTKNEGQQYADQLHKVVAENGLEDQVHFRPFMKDSPTFYAAIDVFVMPSSGETFGTVTIEAMASGLPIIGTNTSGTPEVLKQGEVGRLFQPGDAEVLANHIAEITGNEATKDSLGNIAREEAIRSYDHNVVTDKIAEIAFSS